MTATATADKPARPEPRTIPTPTDRPQADIVLYDGQCKFCLAGVERLQFFDCQKRLAYLSLHDPEVARRWPDLDHDELMRNMYIIEGATGRRHRGADALRYLTRRLRRLWWLAPLLYIPGSMPFWRWCYSQFATRRYLLFGKVEACDSGSCSIHFKPR
ncbi:MAG: DUF393 domain-containing protein [Pirellulales bacterium]|nr:DUF393 domain-containing protein [Pirellulales bacterium]